MVAEVLESGDQPTSLGFGVVASAVVVNAEVLERGVPVEDVPDCDEHGVASGDRGAFRSASSPDPAVAFGEMVSFRPGNGVRDFDQALTKPRCARPGEPGTVFAGGLVVAWAHPRP